MTEPFEFIVFSDFHAHNHTYGATRTTIPNLGGLYNSRLADSASVLDEIREYAKRQDIKHVVFCGDLFHRRTSVPTDVRHVVVDRLHEFVDDDLQLYMIPGNHDMGDRRGNVHHLVGLGELSDHVHVFNKVFSISVEGAEFVFAPYTDDLEECRKMLSSAGDLAELSAQPAILFGHAGMQGAKVGSDYVLISDGDIAVEDVPRDKFAACFFGHFHEHQPLFQNGWFVGATHQHNWGDSGGSRGFLHVTVDKGKVAFEQVKTNAPEFVVYKEGDKKFTAKENDFVRVVTTDQFADVEELKKRFGVEHLEIVCESKEEDTEFKLDGSQLSPSAVLDEWVEVKLPEGLDKDEVLSVGRDILKEVGI